MFLPGRRRQQYLTLFFMTIVVLFGCQQSPTAEYKTEIHWKHTGHILVIDTHTHTNFTDGSHTVREVVEKGLQSGCNALAITDHSTVKYDAATPDYFREITMLRREYPDLLLFAGLEWNIPPYKGREHITVLLDPLLEFSTLPEFKNQFDSYDNKNTTAEAAIHWLKQRIPDENNGVMFYNHPSRKDADINENFQDITLWRSLSHLFVGFEGSPGHQKQDSPGAYLGEIKTEDRWAPVVSRVGGVWDKLLDQGHDIWGALAGSDFHETKGDYDPCQFSRTYISVPEKSYQGIIDGLRAGSFWAEHGHILSHLSFKSINADLGLIAVPGESVNLKAEHPIQLRVELQRGPAAINAPLTVEIIGGLR